MISETEFAALDAQWEDIAIRHSRSLDATLSVWDRELAAIADEHDKLLRGGRWTVGADDVLTILGRARYELDHSAMLAWLLDPLGRHGLGTALLQSLLRLCGVTIVTDVQQARPRLEVQRSNTRADIVVSAPGVTLIIENKVYSGEQERQCDRLYEHFADDPGAVFIFLTPTGYAPRTATGARAEAWTTMSYRALSNALDHALRTSMSNPATTGRATAENYLATLRREFA